MNHKRNLALLGYLIAAFKLATACIDLAHSAGLL